MDSEKFHNRSLAIWIDRQLQRVSARLINKEEEKVALSMRLRPGNQGVAWKGLGEGLRFLDLRSGEVALLTSKVLRSFASSFNPDPQMVGRHSPYNVRVELPTFIRWLKCQSLTDTPRMLCWLPQPSGVGVWN